MSSEFKKIKQENLTRYVLESASGGATGSGAVASVSSPIGGVRRRDSLIAQEADTISVPVTQKPRQGPLRPQTGAGQHRDKKKEQKQGKEKHKKPFMEDHEIEMASGELQAIAKNAVKLLQLVRQYSEKDGLEAWQQSKITKAADYLNSVLQNLDAEQQPVEDHSTMSQGYGRESGSTGQAFAGRMKGAIPEDAYFQDLLSMLEEKVRLDPKCWKGKKIGSPKTKMKGGVRVNNCVPAEGVAEGGNISYSGPNITPDQELRSMSPETLHRILTMWEKKLKENPPPEVVAKAVPLIQTIKKILHGKQGAADGSLNEFAPGNGRDDEDWRDNPHPHIMLSLIHI